MVTITVNKARVAELFGRGKFTQWIGSKFLEDSITFTDQEYIKLTTRESQDLEKMKTQGIITIASEVTTITQFDEIDELVESQDLGFDTALLNNYSEITYSDLISEIDIYTDSTKITKLFNKSFTYVDNVLLESTITRMSDGKVFTKTFTYFDNDNLESVA